MFTSSWDPMDLSDGHPPEPENVTSVEALSTGRITR